MTLGTQVPAKRYTVRDDRGEYVGKAELRRVPVAAIKVDPAYQRDVSAAWVNEHGPFDPQRAGALVLSSRSGGPFCIDGGHRLALAHASGVDFVNAFVIADLTQKDEARLFTRYQRERRNLTTWALFRADMVARDPDTVEMVRVLSASGFELSNKSGPTNITAIDAVRWVFKYGGAPLLTDVLRFIRRVWMTGTVEDKALSGTLIRGLGLFLANTREFLGFKRERVDAVMEHVSPLKLLRLGQAKAEKRKAIESSYANVAEALVDLYNGGVPPRLGPLPKNEERLPEIRISGKRRAAAKGGEA